MPKMCNVSLIFELEVWSLKVAHGHVMMISCAKIFRNPMMYEKVTVKVKISLNKHGDVDLPVTSVIHLRDTTTCYWDYLCKVI